MAASRSWCSVLSELIFSLSASVSVSVISIMKASYAWGRHKRRDTLVVPQWVGRDGDVAGRTTEKSLLLGRNRKQRSRSKKKFLTHAIHALLRRKAPLKSQIASRLLQNKFLAFKA